MLSRLLIQRTGLTTEEIWINQNYYLLWLINNKLWLTGLNNRLVTSKSKDYYSYILG